MSWDPAILAELKELGYDPVESYKRTMQERTYSKGSYNAYRLECLYGEQSIFEEEEE